MKKKDSAVRWGLALFLTVGAILLFYDTLFGRRVLPSFGGQLLKALQPVLIGAVLAYLLAPVIDFIENLFFPEQMKKAHAEGRMTSRSARAVSLVVTWAIIGLLCYLLGHVLMPQLYRSVVQLVSSVEGYYNTISGWVEHLLESNPTVEVWVADQMDKFYESATEWLKNRGLYPDADADDRRLRRCAQYAGVLEEPAGGHDRLRLLHGYQGALRRPCPKAGLQPVFRGGGLLGLSGQRQGRSHLFRLCPGQAAGFPHHRRTVLHRLLAAGYAVYAAGVRVCGRHQCDSLLRTLSGGDPQLLPDFAGRSHSVACISCCSCWPLQQLDGNVIGPKILGESTGLSSLWVIIAILVGGSFFGVAGMFFGVPVCACLYSLVAFLVDRRLAEKDLPVETDALHRSAAEAGNRA